MLKLKNTAILKIISVLAAAAVFIGVMSIVTRAENVTIVDEVNPDLTFIKITRPDRWESKGSFEQSDGEYTLKTNTWGCWEDQDHIDFAYKEVNFNYGSSANLTVTTVLTSWDGVANAASAGIMIRSGLENSAATIFFHCRPQSVFAIYRASDGMTFARGPMDIPPVYPVHLKVVLNKNVATCYYRLSEDSAWIKMKSTVPFTHSGTVYVGIAAHSSDVDDLATSKFSGFEYSIDAPEGTEPGGDTSSGAASSEEEDTSVVLPDDSPVKADTLLRETFTDGDMFSGKSSVTNPLWESNNQTPDIPLDEEALNRYLYCHYDDSYYFAGDQSWTDYSTSMDVSFGGGLESEKNQLTIYTRHTDICQYGYHDYAVTFTGGDTVSIGYREWTGSLSTSATVKATAAFNYLADENIHTIRIDSFDNVITVYWDGVKLLSWADEGTNVKGEGSIGFMTVGASVKIDNIEVRKLTDILGGDYDNHIAGNWDQPIPDYIQQYIDNGWLDE